MRIRDEARLTAVLPPELVTRFEEEADRWWRTRDTTRLLARDAALWTGADEARWLGWLDAPSTHLSEVPRLAAFAGEVRDRGFTHALLIGMGGSSMCPEVMSSSIGARPGFPRLLVLDSTDPSQVRDFERRLDVARTLFIVASKSGSTLEPNLLLDYFLERARAIAGDDAGRQFVAITDPGSNLADYARREGFWRVFNGVPAIGGRYSALSNFGLVPAAVLGLDLRRWLDRAMQGRASCDSDDPHANAGAALGLLVASAAALGRDKLTLVSGPTLAPFGAWVEQLVAESLGKHGKGVVPIDGERLGSPAVYDSDRVFVHLRRVDGGAVEVDATSDDLLRQLAQAGHPVITIPFDGPFDIAREFVRWSVATAVAGARLGVNPFDQPDVEAAKIAARALTQAFETSGGVPEGEPVAQGQGLKVFGPLDFRAGASPVDPLRALLASIGRHDYFALLAFIEMAAPAQTVLERIRHRVRAATRAATTVGFGPRYLHSSGQLHKGGPSSGVFLMITCDEARDLAVPRRKSTFGMTKLAQARGDFEVLASRGRRALRVHLGADVAAGLAALEEAIDAALRR